MDKKSNFIDEAIEKVAPITYVLLFLLAAGLIFIAVPTFYATVVAFYMGQITQGLLGVAIMVIAPLIGASMFLIVKSPNDK